MRTNASISIEQGFCEMWPHVVTIVPRASTNLYGEPVAGTSRIGICAYVDPPSKAVNRNSNRDDRTPGTTVIVADLDVRVDDQIILPTGEQRLIKSVQRFDYVDGLDHSILQVV